MFTLHAIKLIVYISSDIDFDCWFKHIYSYFSNILIYILQYNHDGVQKKKTCYLFESVSLRKNGARVEIIFGENQYKHELY